MDLHQLFLLKEKLLKDLDEEVLKTDFPTEQARREFHDIKMDAIIEFYAHAMITILDSDTSKSSAA